MITLEAEKKRLFRNEQDKALSNILYSSEYLKHRIEQKLSQFGLNLQDWDIMRVLHEQEGRPLSATSLAQMTLCCTENIGSTLSKLTLGNYLELCSGLENLLKGYVLTPKGELLIEQMNPIYDNLLEECGRRFSVAEARLLNTVLDKSRSL